MVAAAISVIGINEDGVLPPDAADAVGAARLVVGGARHLALAARFIHGETLPWPSPIDAAVPRMVAQDGPVAVLASGDPMWFGVASLLLRHVPLERLRILPAPSSFQLAAARLGWALQDTECLSCCGRPVEAIVPHLQPGARLLVLSAGAATPAAIDRQLQARGVAATLRVLDTLGGTGERIHPLDGTETALNIVALEIHGPVAATLPLTPGLADERFEHDGQITKREVRAMTLAALAPRRGELLWDVGCGSGSVGVEWMLAHPANRTIGIDRHPDRAARARRNALALGVPALLVLEGEAPDALSGLPPPHAVFLGGGAHRPGVIDAAWSALRPGGRLVANAIALPTEAALIEAQRRLGGMLTRIGIERLEQVGSMAAYRPAMTVTQWRVEKRELATGRLTEP